MQRYIIFKASHFIVWDEIGIVFYHYEISDVTYHGTCCATIHNTLQHTIGGSNVDISDMESESFEEVEM